MATPITRKILYETSLIINALKSIDPLQITIQNLEIIIKERAEKYCHTISNDKEFGRFIIESNGNQVGYLKYIEDDNKYITIKFNFERCCSSIQRV